MATAPIGSLRDRVTILRERRTDDAGGGASVAWHTVATVWARVQPISASDQVKALALAVNLTHKITLRWRDDLGVPGPDRYKLVWNGADLHIGGAFNPDMKRRFLELTCMQGQMVAA